MSNIEIFKNNEFGEIRTLEINGKPYFVANDIAKALGYANPSKATNDHCKHSIIEWGNDSLGRRQQFKFVPEGDLYRLISHSKLPSAEKFESWIFDDVIPSIRKYGMYATDELLDNPDLIIKMATKLKEERELNKRLQEENEEKNKLIEKQKPKAEFYDEIIDSTTVIGMKEVADILKVKGYGRNNLFKFLREKGILNRKNEPYRKYIEQGLFEIKESKYIVDNEVKIKPTTYVTQKGLDYIRKILNKQK